MFAISSKIKIFAKKIISQIMLLDMLKGKVSQIIIIANLFPTKYDPTV